MKRNTTVGAFIRSLMIAGLLPLLSVGLAPQASAERPIRQITIESKFVEVSNDDLEELGIDWQVFDGEGMPTTLAGEQSGGLDLDSDATRFPSDGLPVPSLGRDASMRSLGDLFRGLSPRILTAPRLTVSPGEEARIEVGGRIPYEDAEVENVQKDFVIELKLTPTVASDGGLILQLEPTYPLLDGSGLDGTGAIPSIDTRSVRTDVTIQDGETVVLGGVFEESLRTDAQKIPQLGEIPGLGRLFRSRDYQDGKSNLLIFVTARLIGPDGSSSGGGGGSTSSASDRSERSGPKGSISTALYLQSLPKSNGGLGVYDVGGRERTAIELPSSFTAPAVVGDFSLPIPWLRDRNPRLNLRGFFTDGTADDNQRFEPQNGIVNGITYWGENMLNSSGISSTGAGLDASSDLDYTVGGFASNLEFEITDCFAAFLALFGITDATCGGNSRFLFNAGGAFDYARHDSEQKARLSNPDMAFTTFDVYTRNELDVEDWNVQATFGFGYESLVPSIGGLKFFIGNDFGLGYHKAELDGHQQNMCDIRFGGMNQCVPNNISFREDKKKSGFDWSYGMSTGFEYQLPWLKGLSTRVSYDLDYIGVMRVRTPTNFDNDGPVDFERTHEPRHVFGLSLSYQF